MLLARHLTQFSTGTIVVFCEKDVKFTSCVVCRVHHGNLWSGHDKGLIIIIIIIIITARPHLIL